MSKGNVKAPKSRVQRAIRATLAVAAVLVLTACGARIDTTLSVEADGSGSRVMVLTLPADDMEALLGGTAAVDTSIRGRLPAELAYTGIQGTSDGGATASFTLDFASTDDYKEKAHALLALSGRTEVYLDFSVTDSLLVKGIQIDEDFSSASLLEWMFNGLIEDGVVDTSNSSELYENGDTVLNYGGESVEQFGFFEYSDVIDNGFDNVSMVTDISGEDITREITLTVDPTRAVENEELYENFFAQATPDKAELTSASKGTWRVTFSGDAESIARDTDTVTGTTGSQFSVDSAAPANDPATIVRTVTSVASCENLCAADTERLIYDRVVAGSAYVPQEYEIDTSVATPTEFLFSPPITSAAANFQFGLFGAVSATVAYVVPNESVKLVGDGFTKLFKPAKEVGTLDTAVGSADTTFTVRIEGGDLSSFAAAYQKEMPGASVAAVEGSGSNLFGNDVSYEIWSGLGEKIGNREVTGALTTAVKLPFGQMVTSSDGVADVQMGITGVTVVSGESEEYSSFQSGGPSFAGLLLIGLGVVALLVAILLLVKNRRRVFTGLSGARERFRVTQEPGELESQFAIGARSGHSGRPAGLLSRLPRAAPSLPRPSMLHWQRPTSDMVATPSLIDLNVPNGIHRSAPAASLVNRPAMNLPRPPRGSLLQPTS